MMRGVLILCLLQIAPVISKHLVGPSYPTLDIQDLDVDFSFERVLKDVVLTDVSNSSRQLQYVPSEYAPRAYIIGYFFKSDYSCTTYPPETSFSFATGVCYANTSSGQNFVFTANGDMEKHQLIIEMTTYWDSHCMVRQSIGRLPRYSTLCVTEEHNSINYFGRYIYAVNPPEFTAPGYEIRAYPEHGNCSAQGRPYITSWKSTYFCTDMPENKCAESEYPTYGSVFYQTSRCTYLSSLNGREIYRNWLLYCFSGNSTVQLKRGSQTVVASIVDVKVGDFILGSRYEGGQMTFSFSRVVSSPHPLNSVEAEFVRITTERFKTLTLTSDHLILVSDCTANSLFSLVQAQFVSTDNCVATVDGVERVVQTSRLRGQGVYTIISESNDLVVVDGIVASPFSLNHWAGTTYYRMLNTWNTWTKGLWSTFFSV